MAQSSSKSGNEEDNIKNLLNKCTEFVAATPDDWFRQLFEIIERNFEGRLPNGGFEALTPIYAMNFGPTDLSVPKFINKYNYYRFEKGGKRQIAKKRRLASMSPPPHRKDAATQTESSWLEISLMMMTALSINDSGSSDSN